MVRIKPLKAMILTDESSELELLREFIQYRDDIKLEYALDDCFEAQKIIKNLQCDLLILDINYSGKTLLDFARFVGSQCVMLITSVVDSFAIEAYEIGIIDYLIKPFSQERFDKSIDRAQIYQVRFKRKMHDAFDIMERYNAFYDRLQNDFRLTDNYYEICKLIIKDRDRKEIMEALDISENTLKVYLRDIYSKTIESHENFTLHRKNKFHQLYLFLKSEFDKNIDFK